MELHLSTPSDHELIPSLSLLGRVLRGEMNSLRSFGISATPPITSGSNQDRLEIILPMTGKAGETLVLKGLNLGVAYKDVRKGERKYLLWCLRGNTSLTHLDLSSSDLDEESYRNLMGLLQVNFALRKVNFALQKIDISGT